MRLSRFSFSGFLRWFSALAVVGLVGACLDDGPNQTGLAYLKREGVRLSTPLYHLTFENFPVDTVFSQEVPLNHYGESLLVVGRDAAFRSTVRLGYQITNQAQHDSLKSDSALNLRLVALPPTVYGYSFLHSSTTPHDSITLLIESFAWKDSSGGIPTDSLAAYHRKVISSPLPFAVLDSNNRVLDTARIALATAFDSVLDTTQLCALNHLKVRLQSDTTKNWLVYLEISPLSTSPDSGLFRFFGQAGSGVSTRYDPDLVIGHYAKAGTYNPIYLAPYVSGLAAMNYQVTHTGSSQDLLYGIARGVHLRFNRQDLLDSISASLARLGADVGPLPTGAYDTRFYVPYASIQLPLRDSLSRVDGPFALDMQAISDVDSAASDSVLADELRIDLDSTQQLVYYPSDTAYKPTDSLKCLYRRNPNDSAWRQAIFTWNGTDTAANDTFNLSPDGHLRELALKRISLTTRVQTVSLIPDSDHVTLKIFFSTNGVYEPNAILDPATKTPLTATQDLRSRYFVPGASSLQVRTTRGIRSLLNRTYSTRIAPDLFLQPYARHAYDTAATYAPVAYPVFGEIDFPRENGKVHVTLDLYLYPLRSNP